MCIGNGVDAVEAVFGVEAGGDRVLGLGDEPAKEVRWQLPQTMRQQLGAEAGTLVAGVNREEGEFIAL